MPASFSLYQKFRDVHLANALMEQLKAHQIPFESESSSPSFHPIVPNYSGLPEFRIKLLPEDFARANKLLESHYKEQLDSVDNSYHLFYFSDEELLEIISKFDEWGHMDQVLAQKILKERNKEISPEAIASLKDSRLNHLEKPEAAPRYLLYLGYFAAVLFGLIGFFIGYHLSHFKKPLPNGKEMFVYRDQDRNHGTRMLLIGTFTFVLFVFLNWWFYTR